MTIVLRILLFVMPLTVSFVGCGGPERNKSKAGYRKRQTASKSTKSGKNPTNLKSPPAAADKSIAKSEPSNSSPRDSRFDITISQIREHQKAGTAVIIDARGPDLFANGHLRGAINIPAGLHESYLEQIQKEISPNQLVIIYCASALCEGSNTVCDYLSSLGYANLRVYKPGWAILSLANVERTTE